jgi:dephospho-CoA kinase
MLRIALTGGIATGKSAVLEGFRVRGVPCLDADLLAHGTMEPGTTVTAAIVARFGAGVLAPDGRVDRRVLGPLVFADAEARRDLEAIVHPAVYRAIAAGLEAFERLGGSPYAVVDIPLLFETGRAGDFDAVVVTSCPPHVQLERLVARGLTVIEARQRIDAQLPTEAKTSRADYVIDTSGSFEETSRQIEDIDKALKTGGSR